MSFWELFGTGPAPKFGGQVWSYYPNPNVARIKQIPGEWDSVEEAQEALGGGVFEACSETIDKFAWRAYTNKRRLSVVIQMGMVVSFRDDSA